MNVSPCVTMVTHFVALVLVVVPVVVAVLEAMTLGAAAPCSLQDKCLQRILHLNCVYMIIYWCKWVRIPICALFKCSIINSLLANDSGHSVHLARLLTTKWNRCGDKIVHICSCFKVPSWKSIFTCACTNLHQHVHPWNADRGLRSS